MDKLSQSELIRYSRHLVLEKFGVKNQLKLKQAHVLVIGAGGLGSPALLYLAAAGVGQIGIVDFDTVDITNLQRQVLFTTADIGMNKAVASVDRLKALNPLIELKSYTLRLTASNTLDIIKEYDIILDGSDNFPTRYLVNDACVLLRKPLVYGSILKFEGQVSVFNLQKPDNSVSTNYRDLFPQPPTPESVPNCEEAGVLGVLPGIIGSLMATEAIKIITGIGKPLADRLLIFDALDSEITTINIPNRNTIGSIKELIDYEDFCGINQKKGKYLSAQQNKPMREITVQELKKLKDAGTDFQLIDVREPHEYDICNLDGELIPMAEIPGSTDKISRDKQVIIHCRSGKRSGEMVLWLEKNEGYENLYNLKGGVLAWAKEIDPTMPVY
jgi:sulfur-carrier protein adenylyltransferase/sulfurtransferase